MALSGGRIDALFNKWRLGQGRRGGGSADGGLALQLETNVMAGTTWTRRVIPAMRGRGHGRIVQCSSILGLVP